jgi:DNA-binding transcriptional MocR family regulator
VVVRARELVALLGDPQVTAPTSPELATAIGELVREGQLPAGVDLPSERDLATALGRSRGTVARAYERLRDEGLAHTRHGAGTTVGCCAGPWASSRGADLVSLEPLLAEERLPGRTVDLRSVRWAPPELDRDDEHGAHDGRRSSAAVRDDLAGRIARTGSGDGCKLAAEHLCLTAGRLRALDVVLAALARPGDPVLVPGRTDPSTLALLRVRGYRPVALPLDRTGRPDVPGWLERIGSRRAGVAVLAASHAAPHGSVLAAHERRLVAESLAGTDLVLVEDVTDAGLWIETPPPPPIATFDPDAADRIVLLGEVSAASGTRGAVAWLHATNTALADRIRTACRALDGAPADAVLLAAERARLPDAALTERRRRHLVAHTTAVIRLVTPAAPRVSLKVTAGGPIRWLEVGGLPGSVVADALQARGVLVTPGSHWLVAGRADPAAVTVSLAGPTSDLVAGIRSLVEVVAELG